MQPYKDYRDIILEFILENKSIAAGTGSGIGFMEQKPDLTNTQIKAGAADINSRFPGWVVIHGVGSGDTYHIMNNNRADVQAFLDKGGFTKEEYEKPITYDEKLKLLIEMEAENFSAFVSRDPIDEWSNNPRGLKIIRSLFVGGYVQKGDSNKINDRYYLTKLGKKSAAAGELLLNPAPQPPASVTVNNHGPNNGPQAYGSGSAHQSQTGENTQIGETNTINPKDHKKWYEQSWAKWIGAVLAGLLIAYLSHIFWPGSC